MDFWFEEEFERAYASGLIEKEIFRYKECILTNSEFSKPFPLLTTFSSLLEHSLNSLGEETPVADPIQRAKVYMETFRESDDENDDFDYEPDYDTSIIPMFGNEPIVNSSPKIGRNDPPVPVAVVRSIKVLWEGGEFDNAPRPTAWQWRLLSLIIVWSKIDGQLLTIIVLIIHLHSLHNQQKKYEILILPNLDFINKFCVPFPSPKTVWSTIEVGSDLVSNRKLSDYGQKKWF